MISKENKDFLHIHPSSDPRFTIFAETNIDKEGIYRIWLEFQTHRKVHVARFTVNVKKGEKPENSNSMHNHLHDTE